MENKVLDIKDDEITTAVALILDLKEETSGESSG